MKTEHFPMLILIFGMLTLGYAVMNHFAYGFLKGFSGWMLIFHAIATTGLAVQYVLRLGGWV